MKVIHYAHRLTCGSRIEDQGSRIVEKQSALLSLLSSIFYPLRSYPLRSLWLVVPLLTLIGPSAFAQIAVVNAATYATDNTVAPDSIAAVFGAFKTQTGQPFFALARPLPTILGGVKVTVNNVDAKLFFTSNGQINFLVPGTAPNGVVNVVVTNSDNTTRNGTVTIARAVPGIFTVTSNGQGFAVAQTTSDGVNYLLITNPDGSPRDVDPGTKAQPNFLVLYATGVRNATAGTVSVALQGVPCRVDYAGPQPDFDGLDQLNVLISPELAGLGVMTIKITIPGRASNVPTMKIGGVLPLIRTQSIAPGQTVSDALTMDDQIQQDNQGRTFFFDAYRFSATGTTTVTVALDLRSSQFDAAILLYKVNSDGTLSFLSFDDQTGGFGSRNLLNNNSLLITVLPDNGDYVILASTADVAPDALGTYTLALTTNVAQQISYGTNLNSASIIGADLQTSGGTYLDAYWFNGTQGDRVQVTMTSAAFNPYLIILKRDGTEITGTTDPEAQVTKTLPETGVYIILATPFEINRTGNYSLSVTKLTSLADEGGVNELAQPLLPAREWSPVRRSEIGSYATRRVIAREQ